MLRFLPGLASSLIDRFPSDPRQSISLLLDAIWLLLLCALSNSRLGSVSDCCGLLTDLLIDRAGCAGGLPRLREAAGALAALRTGYAWAVSPLFLAFLCLNAAARRFFLLPAVSLADRFVLPLSVPAPCSLPAPVLTLVLLLGLRVLVRIHRPGAAAEVAAGRLLLGQDQHAAPPARPRRLAPGTLSCSLPF